MKPFLLSLRAIFLLFLTNCQDMTLDIPKSYKFSNIAQDDEFLLTAVAKALASEQSFGSNILPARSLSLTDFIATSCEAIDGTISYKMNYGPVTTSPIRESKPFQILETHVANAALTAVFSKDTANCDASTIKVDWDKLASGQGQFSGNTIFSKKKSSVKKKISATNSYSEERNSSFSHAWTCHFDASRSSDGYGLACAYEVKIFEEQTSSENIDNRINMESNLPANVLITMAKLPPEVSSWRETSSFSFSLNSSLLQVSWKDLNFSLGSQCPQSGTITAIGVSGDKQRKLIIDIVDGAIQKAKINFDDGTSYEYPELFSRIDCDGG